jgi:hypothetical protein
MAGKSGEAADGAAVAAGSDLNCGGSLGTSQPEKGKAAVAAVDNRTGSSSGERVEQMMANLRLTAAESSAVVIDDTNDLELVDPDRAFVGKVLAPNVLHIQNISAAMRPAWGNPRGLILNPAGDNLFVAEFGSMADRDRVLEGSPWKVGKHAVLMKKYDVDVLPQHVMFDRMAIWARILALPSRLMNSERGKVIATPIGHVLKVESDAMGRCWGGYMRPRVEISVNAPLMRVVTIFSSRLQKAESYAVQYERLPIYCFSCSLLGHSHLSCAHPADRDENGDLPYPAKRLSVDEIMKKSGGSKSGSNTASSAHSGTLVNDAQRGKAKSSRPSSGQREDGEGSSPGRGGRGAARGRGRGGRGRGAGRASETGKELFIPKDSNQFTAGKKQKSAKEGKHLSIEGPEGPINNLALVVMTEKDYVASVEEDALSSDSHKKPRNTTTRSTDQAEAVDQPHQTQ